MSLLDLNNEVLLDILEFVKPVDLINIYHVCKRLRALTERMIDKVVLNLQLTGINCFPNLKIQPFENVERISLNKNWFYPEFSKVELLPDCYSSRKGMFLDDHFYVALNGVIRKYDRQWNEEYLSSEFKLLGSERNRIIMFEKKDNVIFAGCQEAPCMLFHDEEPGMEGSPLLFQETRTCYRHFLDLDFYPKHDLYVTATRYMVEIWNRRPENNLLLPVDKFSGGRGYAKINPSGEKLITADTVTLYDLNTRTKEELKALEGLCYLLWKDDQTVLSGHEYGSLKIFDLRSKSVCHKIKPVIKDNNVSIQFDGQNTVVCGFRKTNTFSISDLRMNRVQRQFHIFDIIRPNFELVQLLADPKHLFVMTNLHLHICDFS